VVIEFLSTKPQIVGAASYDRVEVDIGSLLLIRMRMEAGEPLQDFEALECIIQPVKRRHGSSKVRR